MTAEDHGLYLQLLRGPALISAGSLTPFVAGGGPLQYVQQRQLMSNPLLISSKRSKSGHPICVAGVRGDLCGNGTTQYLYKGDTSGGKKLAISLDRSTRGCELLGAIPFRTPATGGVHNPQQMMFNWFYAASKHIAMYSRGSLWQSLDAAGNELAAMDAMRWTNRPTFQQVMVFRSHR